MCIFYVLSCPEQGLRSHFPNEGMAYPCFTHRHTKRRSGERLTVTRVKDEVGTFGARKTYQKQPQRENQGNISMFFKCVPTPPDATHSAATQPESATSGKDAISSSVTEGRLWPILAVGEEIVPLALQDR